MDRKATIVWHVRPASGGTPERGPGLMGAPKGGGGLGGAWGGLGGLGGAWGGLGGLEPPPPPRGSPKKGTKRRRKVANVFFQPFSSYATGIFFFSLPKLFYYDVS